MVTGRVDVGGCDAAHGLDDAVGDVRSHDPHGQCWSILRRSSHCSWRYLLAAVDDNPTDLQLLNIVVPMLRLLVVREPAACKAVLDEPFTEATDETIDGEIGRTSSGKDSPPFPRTRCPLTTILDSLEQNLDEIRVVASQPGAPMHIKQVASAAEPSRACLNLA